MQEFIITNKKGEYLYYDNHKKLCKTSSRYKATTFKTKGKAYRALNCSFPKNKRKEWDIEESNPKYSRKNQFEPKYPKTKPYSEKTPTPRYRSDNNTKLDNEKKPDWDTLRKNLEDAYSEVIEYKNEIYNSLTNIESELCDCEHACEFFKCNASNGYKLYSMIRERRIKRRFLKNEYRKAVSFLETPCYQIANGRLKKIFKEIDKQTYEPRVLKNLFNV